MTFSTASLFGGTLARAAAFSSLTALSAVAAASCNRPGASGSDRVCMDGQCADFTCPPSQLQGFCRVDVVINEPTYCASPHIFGVCATKPVNGFAPNADLDNHIFLGARGLIGLAVPKLFGKDALAFEVNECKASKFSPWPIMSPSAWTPDVTLSSLGKDLYPASGKHARDEAACEACASQSCSSPLEACVANETCLCWLGCAAQDPTLTSCEIACGAPKNLAVDALAKCLVDFCKAQCVETAPLPECTESSSSSSSSSSGGFDCGNPGDLCGLPGQPTDCCDGAFCNNGVCP